MSRELDAPLVESCVSRLIIDCNRPLDAPDLVPSLSEVTTIPGQCGSGDSSQIAANSTFAHSHITRAIESWQRAGKQGHA